MKKVFKSINLEKFTIKLSSIQKDLERGQTHRTFHEKRFDEFIDKEAKQNYQFLAKGKFSEIWLSFTVYIYL